MYDSILYRRHFGPTCHFSDVLTTSVYTYDKDKDLDQHTVNYNKLERRGVKDENKTPFFLCWKMNTDTLM